MPGSEAPPTATGGFAPARLRRLEAMAERRHFWLAGRFELVLGLLRQVAPEAPLVVDLGAGTGAGAAALEARGFRPLGLDLLPAGLAAARGRRPGAKLVQADVRQLPFANGSIAMVLALDLLEHLEEGPFLAELARVLAPGGAAILSVPALPALWSHRDVAAGHLRRYGRPTLRRALAAAGLEVEVLRFYQFALLPAVAAARLLGRWGSGPAALEERPGRLVNRLLTALNLAEVRLGRHVPWPWGSSLAAVVRKGAS